MSSPFRLVPAGDRAVEIHGPGGLLLRYVFQPDTPGDESPRPYAHPVCTLGGEVLTNFQPADHRWHHGLNFTITTLAGYNFWGGGSYRPVDGYQWRNDHGVQRHEAWLELSADRLAHTLEWRTGADGGVLLREERALTFAFVSSKTWTLRWQATLQNVSGRTLALGQYQSNQGLVGSHYSGLQFRGAPDLLANPAGAVDGIFAEGDLAGEIAVHGAAAHWMEWRGRKELSGRPVTLRFANNPGPFHCFVRRNLPLAALPFQYERDLPLAAGATLAVDHTLTFTDA